MHHPLLRVDAQNRDADLYGQYLASMDNKYVYSQHDGRVFASTTRRDRKPDSQRGVFNRKLSAPVVAVFDVARPYGDESPEPALVLLPQPA